MKRYLPTFIAGFGAAVLSIVPGIKSFSCCLIVPGAAILALILDQRVNKNSERIAAGKAIMFGLMTGLFATIFITTLDVLITFITKTNDFIEALPQSESLIRELKFGPMAEESLKLMKQMAKQIQKTGFSPLYLFILFISNFITNTIFGIIGGLVGMGLLNKRKTEQ
ncbi:DUF4199 domain-containing protein [Ignavibacterium sp.]|uniref:DUF4199 domain-containing protein n=1 Tax=Ignavibacterium sp. TaxID=2651167 RepID=UPI0021FDCF62|nr:DUF4199 domain-containing protein [Ignavibacterium sp.]BDQ01680.1 MAG: hypothetical protein KatS3mg037_0255 [Ignavibacterium sp.]